MAIAFSALSESHTGTTGSASQASFTWNHNSTGARCAVVFVYSVGVTAQADTSVTFGNVTMNRVGSPGVASSGENCVVQAYFLDYIIQGASTAIVVNRNNNSIVMYATAFTFTAAANAWCTVAGLVSQSNSSTAASGETSIDDGSPGTNSVRVSAGFTGASTPLAAGTNSTGTTTTSIDFSSYGCMSVYETSAGQGSRPVGFATGTTDDYCFVALAVCEAPALTGISGTGFGQGGSSTVSYASNLTVDDIPGAVMSPLQIPVRRYG